MAYEWKLPPGFPAPSVPDDNHMTMEKVDLGRHLFYDRQLSYNETTACGTCHDPSRSFTDGWNLSQGASDDILTRNTMSLANVGYYGTYGWADPELTTLEAQAMKSMTSEHPVELGASLDLEGVLDRFRGDFDYRTRFAAAFPDEADPFTLSNIAKAIASFERTLVSGSSPYDRYAYSGDLDALSDSAKRGMTLFFDAHLYCSTCHVGPTFTNAEAPNARFSNTGLYNIGGTGAYPTSDTGLYQQTREPGDMGRFRVPTVRNIAVTAPYMHDGSVATLDEVIDLYARGGRLITDGGLAGDGAQSPYRSFLITGFSISPAEKADLIEFLRSLTDDDFLSDPANASPFED